MLNYAPTYGVRKGDKYFVFGKDVDFFSLFFDIDCIINDKDKARVVAKKHNAKVIEFQIKEM